MQITQIVTGPKPARLITETASELASYLDKLYGQRPRIVARPTAGRGDMITLDAKAVPLPDDLSDQGYVIRPVKVADRTMLQAAGKTALTTMWAVYDLVEQWGVRYELHGDILPDKPPPLKLPAAAIVREPTLKLRCFRTYNDFANNTCRWPAEDHRVLMQQLSKLRINAIAFVVRPYDPFIDLKFHGARKSLAATNFGWRLPIRPDHPGYQLFEQSGDAARGEFSNSELDHHDDYDKAIAAGRRYAARIFRMAHQRGIKVIVNLHFSDFDPAIRKRLLELTRPQHKSPRSQVMRIKYGIWREGADVESGRCMNVRNPLYFELMIKSIQAHIDALPDVDYFVLNRNEFGGPAIDGERAYKQLDRKYKFSRIAPFKQIIAEARETAEGAPDRAEHEVRSTLINLYAADRLINEHGFDLSKARKGAQVIVGALSPELHRYLPSMFPRGTAYQASMGYMPTHVATRMNTVRLDDPESIHFMVVTSLEDDNIGLLAQMTGTAVHKIVTAMQRYGAYGFNTRQWMHSNLLPTLDYLCHASWQRGLTPAAAYEHFFSPICGRSAVRHIQKSFAILEHTTEQLHKSVMCLSFPAPTFLKNFWDSWPASHTPARLTSLARRFEQAADHLSKAQKVSEPAGRPFLHSLERHVRHGVPFLQALTELAHAHEAKIAAKKAHEDHAFDGYDRATAAMVEHLDRSAHLMRQACEIFAEGIRDRNDLGALATLNSYYLDTVEAIRKLATTDADMFSFTDK